MIKRLLHISALLLLTLKLGSAQQQYTFTNYLLNAYYYNPALAGSEEVHKASFSYRNQWTGFEGAPVTVHGNFYGSIRNEMKHGYGISILSDKTGLSTSTGAYLNYAYHLNITDDIRAGFGVRPGFFQYKLGLYDAKLADKGDEILTGNIVTANALDLSSGFHVYSNKFYLTASLDHIFGKAIDFTVYNQSLTRHLTVIAAYKFNLKKQKIDIEPGILFRTVQPVPSQVNFFLRGTYDNKFWAGLSYRTDDAAGISLGMWIKERLNIGYTYDYSLGGISPYQNGSHEIAITFITTSRRPSLDQEDEDLNKSIFDQNKENIENEDESK